MVHSQSPLRRHLSLQSTSKRCSAVPIRSAWWRRAFLILSSMYFVSKVEYTNLIVIHHRSSFGVVLDEVTACVT
uniref:Uncharacterized protein n=1 Tax=Arundo donax TaxID=35708 RepID=A0A0A9G3B2_ARUDO